MRIRAEEVAAASASPNRPLPFAQAEEVGRAMLEQMAVT